MNINQPMRPPLTLHNTGENTHKTTSAGDVAGIARCEKRGEAEK